MEGQKGVQCHITTLKYVVTERRDGTWMSNYEKYMETMRKISNIYICDAIAEKKYELI